MANKQDSSRVNLYVLVIGLIAALTLFGVPAARPPLIHLLIAALLFAVITVAAWRIGGRAIMSASEERQGIAVSGWLLITPIVMFALLPGFGPPWEATHAENAVRYTVLLLGAVAIGGGFIMLRRGLSEAGDQFHSSVGFAAIILATTPYVVFAGIQLYLSYAVNRTASASGLPHMVSLDEMSTMLLFAGVLLTYLATSAFTISLGEVHWIGGGARKAVAGTSLLFALCVGVKFGTVLARPHDPIWVPGPWYSAPGFILSIPAVPWLIPVALGVLLLRRAGRELV